MITLALDASTYVGTVAVLCDGAVVANGEARMRGEHEERLMPAVAAALALAAVSPDVARRADGAQLADVAQLADGIAALRVDRIVCGAGPGSFTSLRIAASISKGLATAWNIPLYAVSSLALIVAGAEPDLPPGRYAAVLDALRGEAYVAVFSVANDGAIEQLAAERRVPYEELATYAAAKDARLVGPGQTIDVAPNARGVLRLESAIVAVGPVDLGAWEPEYGRLAEAQVRWEVAHGRSLSGA